LLTKRTHGGEQVQLASGRQVRVTARASVHQWGAGILGGNWHVTREWLWSGKLSGVEHTLSAAVCPTTQELRGGDGLCRRAQSGGVAGLLETRDAEPAALPLDAASFHRDGSATGVSARISTTFCSGPTLVAVSAQGPFDVRW